MQTKTKLKVVVYVFSLLLVCSLALFSLVKAGSLTPPGTPGATLYTLENIYQRLTAGTPATETDHNFGPSASPSTPTMHSLTDIYGVIPANNKVLYLTNAGTANHHTGAGTTIATGTKILSPYYAFAADGTEITGLITDYVPPIVWQTDDSPAATYTWANAGTYCAGITTGGFTWRLPTINELLSGLANQYAITPPTQTGFGAPCDFVYYWSSSEASASAWFATMDCGGSIFSNKDIKTNPYSVRCVH